jgi:hypothetical protein
MNADTAILTLSGMLDKTAITLTRNAGKNGIRVSGVIEGNPASPDSDMIFNGCTTALIGAKPPSGRRHAPSPGH